MIRRLSPLSLIRLLAVLLLLAPTGCLGDLQELLDELDLDDIEIAINRNVNIIQTQDPRFGSLPSDFDSRGDAIILAANADVIIDISTELVVEELPDITLLAFENLTGFDISVDYAVDGVFQSVLVYDGETLLLEYPCIGLVELISEDDFDPLDGVFVDQFDLAGSFFENPFDYVCGEAVIITFDPEAVVFTPERIDLVR